MNTRNIFTKLSTAVALVAVLSTAGLWEMRHVQAVSENQRAARFSAVTIARGQSMKISAANINPAEVPPDPYRVQLGFVDADGNLLRDPRTGEAYGPFLMNTREEIVQAYDDVNSGKFGYLED